MTELDLVEVQVVPHPGQAGNLSGSALQEKLVDRIDELAAVVNQVADRLREQLEAGLKRLPAEGWGLDSVQMEFSMQLQAEAGIVVARGSTTGGFAVTLSFQRS